MIRVNVEEYWNQCLDFNPDVIPPIRSVDEKGEHTQTDTIIQCKYRKRCSNIKRFLEQQAKGEASG